MIFGEIEVYWGHLNSLDIRSKIWKTIPKGEIIFFEVDLNIWEDVK